MLLFHTISQIFSFFEIIIGGDLQNWLLPKENESEMRITDESRRTVLRTALQGLAYVHANGITHCGKFLFFFSYLIVLLIDFCFIV